jgi:hypothetical protein
MSISAAAKAIQQEHGITREKAMNLAVAAADSMPGDPPAQAIVAEARYLIRRVREGKPVHPIGSGMRFRRQVEAILDSFEERGEPYEGKEARRRAAAIAARQMRASYGDDYVQFLASLGQRRAKVERAAEAEGKLVRLPTRGRGPAIRKTAGKPAPLRRANPVAPRMFADKLVSALGERKAEAFARKRAEASMGLPYWVEVYASILSPTRARVGGRRG